MDETHTIRAFMNDPKKAGEFIWHVFTQNIHYNNIHSALAFGLTQERYKNWTFCEIFKVIVYNHNSYYTNMLLFYRPYQTFRLNYIKGKIKKEPLPRYEKLNCELPNYDKQTLISFLSKEHMEGFIKFLFFSRTLQYPKLNKFFRAIMYRSIYYDNYDNYNNHVDLSQSSAIELILKNLHNIDTFLSEISYIYYACNFKSSFGKRPVTNPFNTLHDIFCEYKPYVDFANYYTIRKERLCFFMEQIYNICGMQKQRLEPIYYVFFDEYIVKNIANFL